MAALVTLFLFAVFFCFLWALYHQIFSDILLVGVIPQELGEGNTVLNKCEAKNIWRDICFVKDGPRKRQWKINAFTFEVAETSGEIGFYHSWVLILTGLRSFQIGKIHEIHCRGVPFKGLRSSVLRKWLTDKSC